MNSDSLCYSCIYNKTCKLSFKKDSWNRNLPNIITMKCIHWKKQEGGINDK